MLVTNSVTFDLLGFLIALLAVLTAYFKWTYSYWKRKGVTGPEPSIPFGNGAKLFLKQVNYGQLWSGIYTDLKMKNLPYGGAYFLTRKYFVPVDINLIKNILQTDFQHFVNHGFYVNEEVDPLSGHLFALEDTKWKNLRAKLTPTFTSGKMKMMFETLANCSDMLATVMEKMSFQESPVDIKEVLSCFSTDVIGSCAFGLECNSLKNPDAEFRKYGKMFFMESSMDLLRSFLQLAIPPQYLKIIKLKVIDPVITKFFIGIVKDVVEYREKNDIYRKDFMHLLIQLKNIGKLSDDGQLKGDDGRAGEVGLTLKEVAAQAFVFWIASFETSASTMTFALYEICQHSEIQKKLRHEIRTVLVKYNNKLTYEAINELNYMDKVVYETLRKYPPIPGIPRICSKDYIVPGTSLKIEKGTLLTIPVLGVHSDPEFYPNPEKFDPERFSEENKALRRPCTFLPFGEGPRICIGLRFGLMQIKVGLATVLRNYEISLNAKTPNPIVYQTNGFFAQVKGSIWLNVKKIEEFK